METPWRLSKSPLFEILWFPQWCATKLWVLPGLLGRQFLLTSVYKVMICSASGLLLLRWEEWACRACCVRQPCKKMEPFYMSFNVFYQGLGECYTMQYLSLQKNDCGMLVPFDKCNYPCVKFPSLLSFCVCYLISVMILITGMCNVKHFLKTGKGWHEIQDNRDDSVKTVAVFQSTDWCSPYLVTLGLIHLEPTHPEKPQCFSFPMSHICCIIQSKRWRHVVNHVRYASSLLLWWPFLTTVLAENVIQNTLMICLILIRWGYNP